MRRAGYTASSARVPGLILPQGGTRALAGVIVSRKPKELTPAAARELALTHLKGVLDAKGVRDDVRVVAAKQLLDYGLNAPDLEPEVTGRDARAWRRTIHKEARLRGIAIGLRIGARLAGEIVAAWREQRRQDRGTFTASQRDALEADAPRDAESVTIDVAPLDVVVYPPQPTPENKGHSGKVR